MSATLVPLISISTSRCDIQVVTRAGKHADVHRAQAMCMSQASKWSLVLRLSMLTATSLQTYGRSQACVSHNYASIDSGPLARTTDHAMISDLLMIITFSDTLPSTLIRFGSLGRF